MMSESNAHANDAEVQECIELCNDTISKANAYIQDLEKVNALQYELMRNQGNKINRLESEATRWYRNPVIIFLTGLSAGIMLNQQANKH